MRLLPLLGAVAACAAAPGPPDRSPPPPRAAPGDAVIERAAHALERGDVADARQGLERDRWLAEDRARAALLLAGCLLLEGRHADAVEGLRAYLEMTPRIRTPRDRIAVHLLRHHAHGGGETARTAEEACYFGLYALRALGEPETAREDLAWARRDAPFPERRLAELAEP